VSVLREFNELKAHLNAAESAARGFELTGDAAFVDDVARARAAVAPGFAMLLAASDSPELRQTMDETRGLIDRRLAMSDELIQRRRSGEAGPSEALSRLIRDGRALTEAIAANLDKARAEHRKRLARQSEDSRRTGNILLAVDLTGVALTLLLAGALIRESRRSRHALSASLFESRATAHSLEAAVAERTSHLVAAHEELQRSSTVLQSTFDSMAEAVLVIDGAGNVVLSNQTARQMLRYRPGMNVVALRGLTSSISAADGVTPLKPEEMPAARALRGDEYDGMEFVARSRETGKPVHIVVSGRPLRDAAGAINGAVLVFRNTTAAHETERKLQQAQKLEAIGQLTGGVAHDFNNMLTVITGTTETLVAGLRDRPDLQNTAKLIDDAAQRCSDLIAHLLAFARRQPLHPRNIDVNATVGDVAKLLRPTLGEQIAINTVLEPKLAPAHLDASQLANALLNMAINSRDAMPGGGTLTLTTRMVSQQDSELDAPAAPGACYIVIEVADTGTGMSEQVRERVFEPFFTTKEVGKGSGLGLSMVYGFVTQSGGHMRIDSEEGRGTTIRIYLPAAQGEAVQPAGVSNAATGGSETILVVEDDVLVRNFVVAQLQSLGYRTLAAPDGLSAVAILRGSEPCDLLFTDVVMPAGMSGRQLAQEAARIRPGLKVLYTSGYSDETIMPNGRLEPGVLLLQKPYRKAELAQMIRRAIDG
jgi:PAS domain S-box-containing protein